MIIYCYFVNNRMIGYGEVMGWSDNPEEIVLPFEESRLIELLGENWREQYQRLRFVDGDLVVVDESSSEQ